MRPAEASARVTAPAQAHFAEILASYLPRLVTGSGKAGRLEVEGLLLSRDDLFNQVQSLIDRFASAECGGTGFSGPIVALKLTPRLAVSFNRDRVRPAHVQCFLKVLVDRYADALPAPANPLSPLVPYEIDSTCEFNLWTIIVSVAHVDELRLIWLRIVSGGLVGEMEALTTPKLYGSKERLTNFLHAVSVAALEEGIPLLDLMSGTGIVSRILSSRHVIFANDANPYAALLTRAQDLVASAEEVLAMIRALNPPFLSNQERVAQVVSDALAQEASFLHGELNDQVLAEYVEFCRQPVMSIGAGPISPGRPHTLVTERYANAYFGVAQSIEIDSLRAAIEAAFQKGSDPRRHICLAALIVAVCLCNSGPHFAQPPKILNLHSLGVIIERRARSVMWEFELALRRLAARPPLTTPIKQVTTLNWSEALDDFLNAIPEGPRAVYVDPPYSKLQYSRYYHVLNVILAYDYPPIHGVGRYPPLDLRFSSRFEFQPGAAEREIEQIFSRCARSKTQIMLSCYDWGFIKIPFLMDAMGRYFGRIDIFCESLQHHSQGVKLNKVGKVNEYVFVAGI